MRFKMPDFSNQNFLWLLLYCCLPSLVASAQQSDQRGELFDMAAIKDPSTLEVDVQQPWHVVPGKVPTRQKLVTINVGEFWPGQNYRVPVRLVVPATEKALGFHLTGGNQVSRLKRDRRPSEMEQRLLEKGIGLVCTVVQELSQMGQAKLAQQSEARFLKSLDPHDKVQYWAWPASLMRAITLAHSESDYFEVGKVAMSGGSKNGATPSMAIISDDRMTAVMGSVSPIWDSPLRLCDSLAWKSLEQECGKFSHPFLGGHFGPNFNRRALANGRSWDDLESFAEAISDQVFISRNWSSLQKRGVDLLFHPGTHDFVAFDLAWGGKHHSQIPVYLKANTGHGKKRPHPTAERDENNKLVFLLNHFVEGVEPLLEPPSVEYQRDKESLKVSVRFPRGAGEETGRIWWIFDRGSDGSPRYLSDLIPDQQSIEMDFDQAEGCWTTVIPLQPNATRVDFFSNHRKTIKFGGKAWPTYLSSPYTRVQLN